MDSLAAKVFPTVNNPYAGFNSGERHAKCRFFYDETHRNGVPAHFIFNLKVCFVKHKIERLIFVIF
jgi:hypothetical protein